MFGIDFDKYTRDELNVVEATVILLGSTLTSECSKTDVDCSECKYRRLCNDCLAAHFNIKATKTRQTRD